MDTNVIDRVNKVSDEIKECQNKLRTLELNKAQLEERRNALLKTMKEKGIDSVEGGNDKIKQLKVEMDEFEKSVVEIDEALKGLVGELK